MKLLIFKVPREFNLFLFGDQHKGAVASYSRGWTKMLDMMESEYGGLRPEHNYAIDHGDAIEAILTDDFRYDNATTKQSLVLEQVHQAARDRSPIKKRLLCMLKGNHEHKLHRFGDVTLEMCKQLYGDDIAPHRYGTYSCKIIYMDYDGNIMFKHYATHGRKSIGSVADDIVRREANMKIQLKRHLALKFGDTLLNSKAHTHKLIVREPVRELYVTDDQKELIQKYKTQNFRFGVQNGSGEETYIDPDTRWYVNTGSFLKTFIEGASTYSEMAEYDPVELGFAVARWRGYKFEGIDEVTI